MARNLLYKNHCPTVLFVNIDRTPSRDKLCYYNFNNKQLDHRRHKLNILIIMICVSELLLFGVGNHVLLKHDYNYKIYLAE